MENEKTVPYYVHEGEMARQERHIKRLWVLCIIIFVTLIGTNAGWLIYESQFEDVSMTVTQDTPSGNNSFVGHDGDIVYGTADHQSKDAQEEDGR